MQFRKRGGVFKNPFKKKTGARLLDFFSFKFGGKPLSGLRAFIRQHHFMLGFLLLALVAGAMGGLYDGMNKKLAERPGQVLAAGTWTTKAPMPTPRNGFGTAAVNGKIYAIGGSNSVSSWLAVNEEYDPITNTWTTKAPMPTPRYGMVVVAVNNKIYAIGGAISPGELSNKVEEYDPSLNTWLTKAPMPTARYHAAGSVINNKIYVVGGYKWVYSTENEEYDPVNNSWVSKAPIPVSNFSFHQSGAAANNKMYISFLRTLDDFLPYNYEYDPAVNSWSAKSALPPTSQGNGSLASLNNKIFSFGGVAGPDALNLVYVNKTYLFDPILNTWTAEESMSTSRAGASTAVVNEKIYVIGGSNGSYLSTNEEYSPDAPPARWAGLAMPAARYDNLSNNSANYAYQSPQIVLDTSDNPFVVWQDESPGNLEVLFTRWDGTKWAKMNGTAGYDNISNTSGESRNPVLALDASNRPYVVWDDYSFGSNPEILFTRWDGTKWARMNGIAGYDNISSDSGYSSIGRIFVDSANRPYVMWYQDDIFVTFWDGTKWAKKSNGTAGADNVTNSPGVGSWPRKIMWNAAKDKLYISWFDWADPDSASRMTHWDGTKWAKMDGTAGSDNLNDLVGVQYMLIGPGPTFDLDSSDRPYVLMGEGLSDSWYLLFTRWDGVKWAKMDGSAGYDVLISGATDQIYQPNIILDSANRPYISYYRLWPYAPYNWDVRLSYWNGSQWVNKSTGAPGWEILSTSAACMLNTCKLMLDSTKTKPYFLWTDQVEIYFTRWDGSKWAKMDGSIGTDNVSNNGGAVDQWMYLDGKLSSANLPYVVWGDNVSGNKEIYFSTWIAPDATKPAIFINSPASFSTSTSPISISGTAVDY